MSRTNHTRTRTKQPTKKKAKARPSRSENSGNSPYAATSRETYHYVAAPLMTSGSSYAYVNYHTNDLYDLAITGSGTNIAGKGSRADQYFNFRVLSYSGTVTAINKETFPCGVYLLHTNTNPGTLGSNYITAAGQEFGQSDELGSVNGMSKHVFRFRHTITEVVGSPSPRFDASYAGNIGSASPTDLTWLSIQASSLGVGNLTNGVQLIVRINLHVLLYGRIADITTFSHRSYPLPSLIQGSEEKSATRPDTTLDTKQQVLARLQQLHKEISDMSSRLESMS